MSKNILIHGSVSVSRRWEVGEGDALFLSVEAFIHLLFFGCTWRGGRSLGSLYFFSRFRSLCSQGRIHASEVQEVNELRGLARRLLLHPFELSVSAKLQLLFRGFTQLRHLVFSLLLQAFDLPLQLQDLLHLTGLVLEEKTGGSQSYIPVLEKGAAFLARI